MPDDNQYSFCNIHQKLNTFCIILLLYCSKADNSQLAII